MAISPLTSTPFTTLPGTNLESTAEATKPAVDLNRSSFAVQGPAGAAAAAPSRPISDALRNQVDKALVADGSDGQYALNLLAEKGVTLWTAPGEGVSYDPDAKRILVGQREWTSPAGFAAAVVEQAGKLEFFQYTPDRAPINTPLMLEGAARGVAKRIEFTRRANARGEQIVPPERLSPLFAAYEAGFQAKGAEFDAHPEYAQERRASFQGNSGRDAVIQKFDSGEAEISPGKSYRAYFDEHLTDPKARLSVPLIVQP